MGWGGCNPAEVNVLDSKGIGTSKNTANIIEASDIV
jgi:hypothetical protein